MARKLVARSESRRRMYAAPEPVHVTAVRRESVKQGRDREPLKDRRRRARRRTSVILSVLILLILGGLLSALWSPAFRIQHVDAAGPDSDGIQSSVSTVLVGTRDLILPRDSIFFFPESDLRTYVLRAYPDVSAVSISRVSFDTIAIDSVPREAAFLWCGTTYTTAVPATSLAESTSTGATTTEPVITPQSTAPQAPCYDTDSQGRIFVADANPPGDLLRVYDAISSSTATTSASPLGDDISEASMIPNALELVKAVKSLGVPIVALVIRGDEADMYAQSGTRITYVLGTEEATAELAKSALPTLDLSDGSLQYVDLRFAGKVYFKKNGS